MKHSATRTLFAYWNSLRGERAAPERSEIDPAEIRHVLADTFMLEVDMAQRFVFRLSGTRVNALFDADQKGRSFLDLWRSEERRNIAAILLTVADSASPVVAGGVARIGKEKEHAFEFLFLPLRHHGKTHARIIGLVKGAAQSAPLGILPTGPFSLRSLRIIDIEECDRQRRPARKPIVSEDYRQEVIAMLNAPAPPRRPNLRLIQGGR